LPIVVGQSLTQPPGAPVAVSAPAAVGTVMQTGLPAGSPLTPGEWMKSVCQSH